MSARTALYYTMAYRGASRHVAARGGAWRRLAAPRGASRRLAAPAARLHYIVHSIVHYIVHSPRTRGTCGASRRLAARRGVSRRVKASAGVVNNGASRDSLFLTQRCAYAWLCLLRAHCHTSRWAEVACSQALRLGARPVNRIPRGQRNADHINML